MPDRNHEPAAIEMPAATIERARTVLRQLQAGNLDRSLFEPAMNTIMDDERVERGARLIRPYGEPVAFVPVALQTTAEGEAALFRVTFATETLTWLVRLGPGQTVNGFVLRHSPNHRIYSVFTRLIEGY